MAKASKFDAAEHFKIPKARARYLSEAFGTGSAEQVVKAMGTLAREKGLSEISRQAGLERVNLFKSLYYRERLKLSVAMMVLDVLDMQLVVVPKKK
jgi:probable addiction module antidote protein